jgi:hypothetical protein
MEIDTQALTTCEVAADGAISLGFLDSDGKPATIRLSLNQVGALAMTLPKLIDKALQARFGDASLRYAYPLASWVVEPSSDPAQGMVTLNTVDGFSARRGAGGRARNESQVPDQLAIWHLTRRYRSRHCAGTHHETAWELFVRSDLVGSGPALRRRAAAVHFWVQRFQR